MSYCVGPLPDASEDSNVCWKYQVKQNVVFLPAILTLIMAKDPSYLCIGFSIGHTNKPITMLMV